MAEKTKKPKKRRRKEPEQTYQHKESGVHITLYDPSGAPLHPSAREEFEELALHVCQKYDCTFMNIAVT